jgi:hypothetical protein
VGGQVVWGGWLAKVCELHGYPLPPL